MTNASQLKQSFNDRATRQCIEVKTGTTVLDPVAYWQRFKGLEFWITDPSRHRDAFEAKKHLAYNGKVGCCFWHAVGPPELNGIPTPCFDYEQDVIKNLEAHRYLWVKKATGLGLTQLMCMYIAYRSLTNDDWKDGQVVIICGPRLELATSIVSRIKGLFPEIRFNTKETFVKLGNTDIEAFPSHLGLASARGQPNVKLAYLDEADFFGSEREWTEALTVGTRYIGKSGAYVCLISTAGRPEGMFQTIEQDPNSMFYKMILDYKVGLHKIYNDAFIQKAMQAPSFPREYEGQYIGFEGNCFSPESLEKCFAKGKELEAARNNQIPIETIKSMGVDPGWSSSQFAIVVTSQAPGGYCEVVYSQVHDNPDFNLMVSEIRGIYNSYGGI